MLEKILNTLLNRENITSGTGELYLIRWTILRLFGYRIYLHKFVADDTTRCAHDHPCSCISFIFKHAYDEEVFDNKTKTTKIIRYKAPTIRFFKASHTHRVFRVDNKVCWSIVLMFKKTRDWGFFVLDRNKKRKWIHFKEYLEKFKGGGCG